MATMPATAIPVATPGVSCQEVGGTSGPSGPRAMTHCAAVSLHPTHGVTRHRGQATHAASTGSQVAASTHQWPVTSAEQSASVVHDAI